jgi:biopolymer transport protein ExbD
VRSVVAADLEILPLMNLFIVLIPMLLLSAVFVELSAIDLNLPASSDVNEPEESLELSVTILDDGYVVRGNGIDAHKVGTEDGALVAALAAIANEFPGHRDIRIVSGPSTRYQEIVSVMDVSREAGLPDVALVGGEVEEG